MPAPIPRLPPRSFETPNELLTNGVTVTVFGSMRDWAPAATGVRPRTATTAAVLRDDRLNK
jgi:hypothetical protein